jgi:LysM repeat protein
MSKGELRIAYTIKQGDNLLKVAQCFQTTVDKILSENKHIKRNKYNVGEVITVVPGSIHNFEASISQLIANETELELIKEMRFRLQEHVFWTRAAIISILEDLEDKELIVTRLLQNAKDVSEVFSPYYSEEVVDTIDKLIEEHLTIAANLVTALRRNNAVLFERYNEDLYKNADAIAQTLASINPYYDIEELREMLYQHLDLLIRLMVEQNNKNYVQQIKDFDASHEQIVLMADMLTEGIVKQFPHLL